MELLRLFIKSFSFGGMKSMSPISPVILKVLSGFLIFLGPGLLFGQNKDSVASERSFAIYPAFGYQPETSVQLGSIAVWLLKSKDQSQLLFQRRSTFSPFFLYTFRNQILSEANLDYYFNNGINMNTSVRIFSFPDIYFGIGGDTNPDEKETYSNVYQQLGGQIYTSVTPRLFAGIAYDLHTTRIRDVAAGGMLESEAVNGLSGGNILGFGPSIRFDSRDNVIYPTKGYFLLFEGVFNHFGDFNYSSYAVDLKKFFSIGNEKNIIGVQINGRFSAGSDIPFYKLPQLGGAERIRGITNASLYRDRQSVYSQIEYRRHLFWRIGLVTFVGMGDVSATIKDFDLSTFKYVGGVGYRFAVLPNQKLNLRFDFGISNEGQTAFYLGMREAF